METGRIPNRLKKYRLLAGMTQKKVASLLNVRTACISRWEKGSRYPGIEDVLKLGFLYQTLPNHLYFETWEKVKKEIASEMAISR
jgi:transcriptional regulator with XRE-family HTH domain